MLALSIRQPFVELILRGIKTAELRTRPTRIIGERFYLYASKSRHRPAVWSTDLQLSAPPAWMIELAEQMKLIPPELLADGGLPTGVIVGTAKIAEVVAPAAQDGGQGLFRWQLTEVKRLAHPRKPRRRPQPVWFEPF